MLLFCVILGIVIFCAIAAVLGCLVRKSASAKEWEDIEQTEFLKRWNEQHSK